jgi:hypothetical protein
MALQKAKAQEIDPARLYVIRFSSSFEHDGVKYRPRAEQKVRVLGVVVEAIKDKIDSYEAI